MNRNNCHDSECVHHLINKGDTLFAESASFAKQPVLNSHRSKSCTNCLCPITGSSKQKILQKCFSATSDARYSSTCAAPDEIFHCPFGSRCTAIFCSDKCCKIATGSAQKFGWHRLLCIDEALIGGAVSEFEKYCMHTSETFLLVATLIARTISVPIAFKHTLKEHTSGVPWNMVVARSQLQANCVRYEMFSRTISMLHDEISQAWQLLMLCWCQIQEFAVQALVEDVTLDNFSELAAAVELTFKPATWEKPTETARIVARKSGTVFLDKVGNTSSRPIRVFNVSDTSGKLALTDTEQVCPKVNPYLFSTARSDKAQNESVQTWDFLITGRRLSTLLHSCCPNAQIELETETYGLLAKVIALHDVSAHEQITISYVDTSMAVESRQRKLISQFGLVCSCARCCWESNKWQLCLSLKSGYMYRVALQYLEEDRYYDAELLLRFLICREYSADILHSIGQAFLGQDKWGKSHTLWRSSQRLYPTHSSLKNQIEKDDAYQFSASETTVGLEHLALHEFMTSSIWLTKQPILSAAQCAQWVQRAERAAHSQGGWNTSRHYGVPTTDIPIHSIPGILDEWNQLMVVAINPLLATVISSAKPQDFRVHDAFIVKYDFDNGQHYLPVHRDQGQLSLTIALNDLDEYAGGGTLFDSHSVIIRPPVGHFVAFKSAIMHGGAPVSRGIRYIIAAFLYLVDTDA